MKSLFLLIPFFAILLSQSSQDVLYVKYFDSDFNFKSDLSMLSTDRRGKAHLAVSYNALNQPTKIERFASNGVTQKLEMLKYDAEGKMTERGEYNKNMQYQHLTVYGDNEEWSKEYRAWRYKINEPLNFSDQQTHFTFYDGVEVKKIVFQTIDGQKYGQIELDYDYLGYLAEERWRDLPSARIVRRFKYKFDIIYHGEEPSTVVQIWEFGHDGELVSSVAADMAPADELYLRPPPRSHNTLDEVEIIAKEIYRADKITATEEIKQKLKTFENNGFKNFPVCVAKTQYSFSTDPKLKGAPTNHEIPIRDVRLSSGAEFIVVICGSIMTMPGLPKIPAADKIKLNKKGQVEGLF